MPCRPITVRVGDRYGRLVVVRDRDGKEPRVLVVCDCGSQPKLVHLSELRRRTNPLRSCGCGREAGWANLRPGTSLPGASNPSAKLTPRKVQEIRRSLERGESRRSVSWRYRISASQLARIANRQSWKGVP
jgi:hypothetical protein